MSKRKQEVFLELCPHCGNEIEAPAAAGEIRKCPYCRRRYIVQFERRNRKYLREYIKLAAPKQAVGSTGGQTE